MTGQCTCMSGTTSVANALIQWCEFCALVGFSVNAVWFLRKLFEISSIICGLCKFLYKFRSQWFFIGFSIFRLKPFELFTFTHRWDPQVCVLQVLQNHDTDSFSLREIKSKNETFVQRSEPFFRHWSCEFCHIVKLPDNLSIVQNFNTSFILNEEKKRETPMRKKNIDEKALTSATSKWREMDQYKLGAVYVSVHSWKQTWPPTERQVFLILRLYLQILPNILPLFGDFSMHAAILSQFFSHYTAAGAACCWSFADQEHFGLLAVQFSPTLINICYTTRITWVTPKWSTSRLNGSLDSIRLVHLFCIKSIKVYSTFYDEALSDLMNHDDGITAT